jgi:hypothetical protein
MVAGGAGGRAQISCSGTLPLEVILDSGPLP